MATITLQNVHFHYASPYVEVFEDLTLHIETVWRTALIGRNGRGKTTLLNLLRNTLTPAIGRVHVPVEMSYFPFEPGSTQRTSFRVIKGSVAPFMQWEKEMEALLKDATEERLLEYGWVEERYRELGGYQIDAAIHREASQLGLDEKLLAQRFETLSGGEKTRALIVALFLRREQYVLLDEPTNHLDIEGRVLLSRYLAAKQGFLVASHDRSFLDGCVDHVISINRNDVLESQGNYTIWRQQNDMKHEAERHQNEKLKREIKQLEKAARQKRDWSDRKEKTKLAARDRGRVGHLAAKQMKRALTIERRVHDNLQAKQRLFKNYEKDRILKLSFPEKMPKLLLRIQDLGVDLGGKTILSGLSLAVARGDRIGIVGGNGTGKTTLFRAIEGEIEHHAGSIDFPNWLSFSRSYQEPRWQSGFLHDRLQSEGLDETRFRHILGVFDVEGDIFDHPLQSFSQGQLKKVDLCRSFMSPAHLLLWDEPLNYIDIPSREQIERVILEFEPTMLFIEHDKYFIDKIATDVVIMDRKKPQTELS